jgi:hypothetical protein
MKISQIISFIIIFSIGVLSFVLGSSIEKNGKSTMDFCTEHYHNETFRKTIAGEDNDSPEPLQCQTSTWRIGWYGLCNKTCFENYNKCLEKNATAEQIRYSQECHWMGSDYFIMGGTFLFKFFVPLIILVFLGSMLCKEFI